MFDIGRSMFDVHQFLSRLDWTLAASGGARVKLQFKLQICHQGTKTQRDDMYFNLGALESLWLNE
jgi:hypothetical protein